MDGNLKKLPSRFLRRLRLIYPYHFLEVTRSFWGRTEMTFRLNYLKIERHEALQYMQKTSLKYREIDWLRGAFVIPKDKKRYLQNLSIYQEGKIYIQGLSSIFAAYVLGAQTEEIIGDFCASPGGKATFLASHLRGKSRIIAFEKQKARFYKLRANLVRQGAERIIEAYIFDASYAFKRYPQYFDRILVDAPCTAESRFLVNNPRTWKYWSERKIKESQRRQKRILFSAVKSLKPQGILVYCTCTFAPEENEEVIDWLLNKFPRQLQLERINTPFSNVLGGVCSFGNKTFTKTLQLSCRIIPNNFMEGFFLAKLRKIKGG